MLKALTQDPPRNEMIADDIANQVNKNNGICLVVSDRIAHLQQLASNVGGISHYILTSKTPAKKRKQIVADVQAGEVKVLFSTLSIDQ